MPVQRAVTACQPARGGAYEVTVAGGRTRRRIGALRERSGRPRSVEPNARRDLVGPGDDTHRLRVQDAAPVFFGPADVRRRGNDDGHHDESRLRGRTTLARSRRLETQARGAYVQGIERGAEPVHDRTELPDHAGSPGRLAANRPNDHAERRRSLHERRDYSLLRCHWTGIPSGLCDGGRRAIRMTAGVRLLAAVLVVMMADDRSARGA